MPNKHAMIEIALGRVIWNVVDVAVAIGLVYLVVTAARKKIS